MDKLDLLHIPPLITSYYLLQFSLPSPKQGAALFLHVTMLMCFLLIFGLISVPWIVAVKVKAAVTLQEAQSNNNYGEMQEKKSEKFGCEVEIHVDASRQ